MLKSISMIQIMKSKAQVIFDIGSEKFKYLEREEKEIKRVDMRDLNARLNEKKKANLYNNSKIIVFFEILHLMYKCRQSKHSNYFLYL